MDLKEINIAPIVAINKPPTTFLLNLLFCKKKFDKTLIMISLQLDNIEVNNDEFFSLLINKHIINPTQKEQLIKSVIKK